MDSQKKKKLSTRIYFLLITKIFIYTYFYLIRLLDFLKCSKEVRIKIVLRKSSEKF